MPPQTPAVCKARAAPRRSPAALPGRRLPALRVRLRASHAHVRRRSPPQQPHGLAQGLLGRPQRLVQRPPALRATHGPSTVGDVVPRADIPAGGARTPRFPRHLASILLGWLRHRGPPHIPLRATRGRQPPSHDVRTQPPRTARGPASSPPTSPPPPPEPPPAPTPRMPPRRDPPASPVGSPWGSRGGTAQKAPAGRAAPPACPAPPATPPRAALRRPWTGRSPRRAARCRRPPRAPARSAPTGRAGTTTCARRAATPGPASARAAAAWARSTRTTSCARKTPGRTGAPAERT